MFSLVIDTANDVCSFAIIKEVDNKKLLVSTSQTKTHNNLIDLAADILDNFLKINQIDYKDLNNVYVNIGPGSFTGEKAGLNIAKTIWSVNPGLQIYTTNTIEVLTKMNGIGVLDAKGNKSYFGVYKNFKCLEPIHLVENQEIEKLASDFVDLDVFDYQKTNHETFLYNMFSFLDSYKLVKSPVDLEPLYIKEAL